jgi:hypothetical protein
MICAGADVAMGGVGGSGLFRSELVLFGSNSSGVASAAEKSSKDTVCGVLSFTSFPWRCLGAGGGFFFSFLGTSARIRPTCSSSDAAMSYDVRGDSGRGSCAVSNIDWRDMEEVSVLLLLSKTAALSGMEEGTFGAGAELPGLVMPFISRFLKPSTFNDCRLRPGAVLSEAVRSTDKHVSMESRGFEAERRRHLWRPGSRRRIRHDTM